jgi:hypothetical protein
MLASGISGATSERYVRATTRKIASIVTTVISHKCPSMATFVSYWTSRIPVTVVRSGPEPPNASRVSLAPVAISVRRVPRSKKSSTGSALLPSRLRSTRVGSVWFWAASGTARCSR